MTIPLNYRGIADDIAARIDTGEYPPGTQIPSYSQLAQLYSVSISTAQRAVMVLRVAGRVQGAQGRGVFVIGDDTDERSPQDNHTDPDDDNDRNEDPENPTDKGPTDKG